MWGPATALLWECWRLSRWVLAILMFAPTLLGATLLFAGLVVPAAESPPDLQQGPTTTLLFAVLAGILSGIWATTADRRRGFKLALGFARPIPTWVLVTVPMAYIGVSCAVTYLVPMLALRTAFGIPFPLFPVAALVSTLCLINVAVVWWTGDSARRRIAWSVLWLAGWVWIFRKQPLGSDPSHWPELLSFQPGSTV